MICDLAETYRIYDYRALPVKTLAVLVCGLGDDSRVGRKLSGLPSNGVLLAVIADRLTNLAWMLSGDKQEPSYFLLGKKKSKNEGFDSPDEFMNRWSAINKG